MPSCWRCKKQICGLVVRTACPAILRAAGWLLPPFLLGRGVSRSRIRVAGRLVSVGMHQRSVLVTLKEHVSAQHNPPLPCSGKTSHGPFPVSSAVGHRVGLHTGPKLEGERRPPRTRRRQVEGTGYRGLRVIVPVSVPQFGKGPARFLIQF